MAWDWGKDWWKVALAVVATGAAVATGGALGGAAVAAWAGVGTAAVGAGAIYGSEQLEIEEEKLDLQKEALKTELEGQYNSALSNLSNLQTQFDTLYHTTIPDLENSISGLETKIDLWDEEYDLQVGEIEAGIQNYDNLLTNWQSSYDAQTRSAQAQGRDTLGGLLNNWAQAEVIAADRGMGGSMKLVAGQEKARAVEFAGEDLSLAGEDGIYGASYATMVANLSAQKTQYETERNLLGQNLELTKINLDNMLDDWKGQLETDQDALDRQKGNLEGLYTQLDTQYKTAKTKHNKLGLDDPVLTDYSELLKEYKGMI